MKYSFQLGASLSNQKQINDLLSLSRGELAEKLNSQIGAYDDIIYFGERYSGILIAKVVSVEPHPDADKLKVVKIDDGDTADGLARDEEGYVQVVCGAPNVREGILVAWIPPGATVPASFEEKEPFKLATIKLRGVVSNGMLASAKELGINNEHDGILEIEDDAKLKPGTEFKTLYGLDDVIVDFENKMFTHRPDCFGHLGIAREVAAIQGLKFKSPQWYKYPAETLWKSYVMGIKDAKSTLAKLSSASINSELNDNNALCVSMNSSQLDKFIEIIKDAIKPGFWTDIVKSGGLDTIFLFKESEDSIKQLVLSPDNHDHILELCNKYAKADFSNINDMLSANSWYQDLFTDDTKLKVSILTKNCPKYRATVIEDVKLSSSPLWMQSFLSRFGMRPINNLVDITNYMMILTSQPHHAFDLDKLKKLTGSDEVEIIVRHAKEGERLSLLNGKAIKLTVEDVVISTPEKAVALAGIMGGSETEVDENTQNILLETAVFDMYSIRRTSMRHGLFTDGSTRHTKGQPAGQIDVVAAKTAQEYEDIAGGKITLSLSEGHASPTKPLNLNIDKLNSVLGTSLDADQISEILERVEIGVEKENQNLTITPPFWRTDLEKEEDVIEEVGRIYGFNNIEATLQSRQIDPARINPMIKLKQTIRAELAKLGANEVLTYSFVHSKLIEAANQHTDLAFKIRNALSPDLQYYRLSLVPSLLSQIHKNIKDGFNQLAIFEIGKVHIQGHQDEHDDQVPKEMQRLALSVASKKGSAEDAYYQAKLYLTELMGNLQIDFELIRTDKEFFGEKIPVTAPFSQVNSATIFVDEKPVGIIGNFSPATAAKLKLPQFSAGFELDLANLVEKSQSNFKYQPLAKYPAINQDLTIEVPAGVNFSDVERKLTLKLKESGLNFKLTPVSIYQAEGSETMLDSPKNLQSSGPAQPVKTNFSFFNEATASPQKDKTTFSSPESKPEESQFLGEASRNITFNVWLNHPDRTLEVKEVTSLMENIASHFTNM
jgi:phenylalanyl-tRNA synthetase beta subunit